RCKRDPPGLHRTSSWHCVPTKALSSISYWTVNGKSLSLKKKANARTFLPKED
ncbi:unnamed protein product, partial [Bubo scandiacus]